MPTFAADADVGPQETSRSAADDLKEEKMAYRKPCLVALAAGLALAFSIKVIMAATIINVELWDKGPDVPMTTGLTYGAPGLDMSKAMMGVRVSQASAPAGVVSFQVTNTSKETVHEMIILNIKDPTKPPPYSEKSMRIDEDHAGYMGEVSELQPGKSGSKTLALKSGKYLLVCNVLGHYAAGMWAEFEVTK